MSARRRLLNRRLPEAGPPACFAELLQSVAANRQLSEETAAAEMVAILRGFAQRHDEFLQQHHQTQEEN